MERGFSRNKRIKKRIRKNASIFDKRPGSIDIVNFKSVLDPLNQRKSAFFYYFFQSMN